jgi:hypothetical protein
MNNAINGRTPEEIKAGLEYCVSESVLSCDECPYAGKPCDGMQMFKDALALIQQLERERDAAVEDIFPTCANCKHEKLGYGVGPCPPVEEYVKMIDCSNWQWRGVQEVE